MHPLRIVFVTPYVPSRLRPRPLHIIRGLAERGHRITLLSAATTVGELADAGALTSSCESVRAIRISRTRSLWSCAAGLFGAPPLQARYCFSPHMSAAIGHALTASEPCDVMHVEHLRAARYGLNAAGLPRVYDAVDCMSRLLTQTAASGPTWSSRLAARIELPRTRRFEAGLLRRFDRVLLTAESERQAIVALGATPAADDAARGRICVLPNGVDLEFFAPTDAPRDPATVVFVGRMAYHANLAAARRLVGEIMPRLWTQRPAARLLIVGPDPPTALRRLAAAAGPRVEITGYVADVRPYLARATVSVNPLPYAVGIQNKLLEAMAMATPVVATPAAGAALQAVAGEHFLIADAAETIAAAVERLFDDPALARRLGAAGRGYVEAMHDWRRVAADLEAIYRDAITAGAAAQRRNTARGPA